MIKNALFFEGAAVSLYSKHLSGPDEALCKQTPTARAHRMKTNVGEVRHAHIHKVTDPSDADPKDR